MEYRFRVIPGGLVATIESFAAGPGAPLVHFAHATGMHAGIYTRLFELLAPRVNLVASDARGHGLTELAANPAALTGWTLYAADLTALLATLPPAPKLILAGHSMGATVSMEVAAAMADPPVAAVIIEPAFVPFARAATWTGSSNPMVEQARRRRAVWPSRADVWAAYHGRGVFATWPDAALDAYLLRGMRDRADGSVELACAPEWEAATFAGVSPHLEAAITGWQGGLTLLHGTVRSTVGLADAATIAARPSAVVRCFDGADHFVLLAEPAAIAEAILAYA